MREVENMGIIGCLIDNKLTKIKKDKFLENINNLIKDGDRQKSDLYRLNNHLKSELLNFTKLSEIFNIDMNMDFNPIPWRFTEKIDENSIVGLTNYRYMKEIDTACQETIHKFNNIVDDISQYYMRISQYNDVIKDIKCYIEDKKIPVSAESLIKFGLNKNKDLFCILCYFSKQKITRIRDLEVDIFYGKFHEKKDYYSGKGLMQLGVDVIDFHPSIEIKVIDIRAMKKKLGMGSFTLRWLEEIIITELNRRIDKFNSEPKSQEDDIKLYHIEEIFGYSGNLSSDTDSRVRERFYIKNGYTMNGNAFTKALKY
jgi:hypothetical protein